MIDHLLTALMAFIITLFFTLFYSHVTIQNDCRLLEQFRIGTSVYDCLKQEPSK